MVDEETRVKQVTSCLIFNGLHGVISQKIGLLILKYSSDSLKGLFLI
jgi:hypothetical protein